MSLFPLMMNHRFNVYRPTQTPNAAGDPGPAPTYALLPGGPISAHKEGSPSARNANIIGRAEGDNIFTLDLIHVPVGTDLQADDWLENVTPGTPDYGSFWVIRGQKTEYDALGVFAPLARLRFEAFQHPTAPFSV